MDPGPQRTIGRLKGADLTIALQSQSHFVETLQETFATAWIDREPVALSGR
jgi:hypothetical protein